MGGKHAIFNIFSAVIDEGDDVIIPTPYWVSFGDIARYVGANVDLLQYEGVRRVPAYRGTVAEVADTQNAPGCRELTEQSQRSRAR